LFLTASSGYFGGCMLRNVTSSVGGRSADVATGLSGGETRIASYLLTEYLERLGDAYARFFYDFDEAPLLIVNAASIDPIHRESDYLELLQTILRVRHGRHFFNPAGSTFD